MTRLAASALIYQQRRATARNDGVKRPDFMELALAEAEAAADRGEVPVGAVLALDDRIVASAGTYPRILNDPTAHAELVIRAAASQVFTERPDGADLYVTWSPAPCAAAISRTHQAAVFLGDGRQGRRRDERRAVLRRPHLSSCSRNLFRALETRSGRSAARLLPAETRHITSRRIGIRTGSISSHQLCSCEPRASCAAPS